MRNDSFDFPVPVIVIGGGACGCIAALAAKEAGADVLLIEQDARPMGSTGMSQGLICAAGTKAQAAHDIADDGVTFLSDIMTKTRGLADPVIARTIAFESGPTVDWLIDELRLPWTLDTRFRPSYGNTTYRVHGWSGHGGQDMVDLLHQRLSEAGIDVLLQARLTDIFTDPGGLVRGIAVARPDGAVEQIGCDALILASGGFAANHDMVARYLPEMTKARNNGHEGSQGIAVTLGQRLGAALGDMGAYQGYGMLTEPQGISLPPGILYEGGVIVNVAAHRFVDESEDVAGIVIPVLAQAGDHVWVVFDDQIEQACSHIPETRMLIELGAAKLGASADELAARIGVDPSALSATLAEAAAAQGAGKPDQFGRVWGNDRPPSPPLRALKVVGALYHTQGGLQIDSDARVLRPDGSTMPNLFAGGGAARSVSGPSSWGYLPAMGLCTAVTLGRLAGRSAARQVLQA
ncbi:FAD-dependent oxidoreductase [Sphingomonas sp. 28-63-12]|uniref:FAD-dependent oxidoreductase n=1 Tax=Sphingomonas sp. 28-63-12 TaxID=1970434 RepID=UPI0035A8F4A1